MKGKDLLRLPGALVFVARRDPAARRRLGFWLRSLRAGSSPLADELPWLTFAAIDWLEQTLRPGMEVFEWGSGGSTLFLARRAGRVTAVEHDAAWQRRVAEALASRALDHAACLLVEPRPLADGEASAFRSRRARYAGFGFEDYARAIDARPDRSLDLVLVDGRARLACARRALAKLRPGGHLLLDNSERREYAPLRQELAHCACRDFFGVGPYRVKPWGTTVWRIA